MSMVLVRAMSAIDEFVRLGLLCGRCKRCEDERPFGVRVVAQRILQGLLGQSSSLGCRGDGLL